MAVQTEFYSELCREKFQLDRYCQDFERFCANIDIPMLNDLQSMSCEGQTTEDELAAAVKNIKNDSAPGLDGLTTFL